ncbi:hypothetical protein [Paenibacillus campinasensis]|uniref:Uncharacterized protein n=1 Tax=Paenibacillus campinasensis TaxID=66347 RepID=A0A268EQ58_9BACL|nr:hypothetical protein [Paenibacillus campinasensis]PAD75270.1 hypothetical protein CHH67_15480 [Paenibacillus campinasensis]
MRKPRWSQLLTAVTTVVMAILLIAGCTGKSNPEETAAQPMPGAAGTAQQQEEEPPVPTGIVNQANETMKNEGAEETEPVHQTPDDTVRPVLVKGDIVQLETSVEHETLSFEGREYELEPYGLSFAIRTTMGEPSVEGGTVTFTTDLSGEATVTYEVLEHTTLDEAAAKEQQHERAFNDEFIDITSENGLKGKQNQYADSDVFSGVIFYAFDQHIVRIGYRSDMAAVDTMARIINETMASVKTRD